MLINENKLKWLQSLTFKFSIKEYKTTLSKITKRIQFNHKTSNFYRFHIKLPFKLSIHEYEAKYSIKANTHSIQVRATFIFLNSNVTISYNTQAGFFHLSALRTAKKKQKKPDIYF